MDSIVATIPLDLDKRRHLRLDNRAILRAERELCVLWGKKQNLLTVLAQEEERLTLNDIAVLLWAGLLHEDPTLTLAQTQDLMGIDKIGPITVAVFAAWNAAIAPAPGSVRAQEEPDGPLASTGAPSGPMGAAALA